MPGSTPRSSTRSKLSLRARSAREEVDGADVAAGLDAGAVRLAFGQIDLVAEVDRLLRAGMNAGITARAHFQVDCVGLLPTDLERAEIAADRLQLARPDRVAAHRRKLGTRAPGT